MKPSLSLRVSQHLALTPQLQQSIRLLQLSTLDLAQEVEHMLDTNPLLEREDAPLAPREEFGIANTPAPDHDSEGAAPDAEEEISWEGDGSTDLVPDDGEWGCDAPPHHTPSAPSEEADASEVAHTQMSLQAYVHQQAQHLRTSPMDRAALHYLIESLNEDGYLEDSLEQWVERFGPDEDLQHHFSVALGLLHSLDPPGVGARHLGECLQLQLHALLHSNAAAHSPPHATLQLAWHICAQPLELLARRDIKRLMQLCQSTEAETRAAIQCIGRLEPKPGRRFASVARHAIVPDVLVSAATSHTTASSPFRVRINPDVMPRLRTHALYTHVLRNHAQTASHAGLQQHLQEARWFIKAIEQRFDTILRVSTAIVARQRGFFTHGPLAMRPLVLREIADELGLHESTLSRVTSAKYMATPQGTFELKYFFGSGLGTDSGASTSSTAVRALIQQFISAENNARPLSDQALSDMLKEQGVDCARRTVAKYREGLKIAPASLRKAL